MQEAGARAAAIAAEHRRRKRARQDVAGDGLPSSEGNPAGGDAGSGRTAPASSDGIVDAAGGVGADAIADSLGDAGAGAESYASAGAGVRSRQKSPSPRRKRAGFATPDEALRRKAEALERGGGGGGGRALVGAGGGQGIEKGLFSPLHMWLRGDSSVLDADGQSGERASASADAVADGGDGSEVGRGAGGCAGAAALISDEGTRDIVALLGLLPPAPVSLFASSDAQRPPPLLDATTGGAVGDALLQVALAANAPLARALIAAAASAGGGAGAPQAANGLAAERSSNESTAPIIFSSSGVGAASFVPTLLSAVDAWRRIAAMVRADSALVDASAAGGGRPIYLSPSRRARVELRRALTLRQRSLMGGLYAGASTGAVQLDGSAPPLPPRITAVLDRLKAAWACLDDPAAVPAPPVSVVPDDSPSPTVDRGALTAAVTSTSGFSAVSVADAFAAVAAEGGVVRAVSVAPLIQLPPSLRVPAPECSNNSDDDAGLSPPPSQGVVRLSAASLVEKESDAAGVFTADGSSRGATGDDAMEEFTAAVTVGSPVTIAQPRSAVTAAASADSAAADAPPAPREWLVNAALDPLSFVTNQIPAAVAMLASFRDDDAPIPHTPLGPLRARALVVGALQEILARVGLGVEAPRPAPTGAVRRSPSSPPSSPMPRPVAAAAPPALLANKRKEARALLAASRRAAIDEESAFADAAAARAAAQRVSAPEPAGGVGAGLGAFTAPARGGEYSGASAAPVALAASMAVGTSAATLSGDPLAQLSDVFLARRLTLRVATLLQYCALVDAASGAVESDVKSSATSLARGHLSSLISEANFAIDAAALVLAGALEALPANEAERVGVGARTRGDAPLMPCLSRRPMDMGVFPHWLAVVVAHPWADSLPDIVRDVYEGVGEVVPGAAHDGGAGLQAPPPAPARMGAGACIDGDGKVGVGAGAGAGVAARSAVTAARIKDAGRHVDALVAARKGEKKASIGGRAVGSAGGGAAASALSRTESLSLRAGAARL